MDVRKKLIDILRKPIFPHELVDPTEAVADYLLDSGVTVQELYGCEYCKEDNEGFRRMLGAFSLENPFHGKTWKICAGKCKPMEIYFCPMCGRRLLQPRNGSRSQQRRADE